MTAVEKFIEQLEKQGDSWENVSIGRIQISIKVEDYLELQRQAKEMEKEQIGYSKEDVREMLFMALYEPQEECCTTHTKDSIVRNVLKTFKSWN